MTKGFSRFFCNFNPLIKTLGATLSVFDGNSSFLYWFRGGSLKWLIMERDWVWKNFHSSYFHVLLGCKKKFRRDNNKFPDIFPLDVENILIRKEIFSELEFKLWFNMALNKSENFIMISHTQKEHFSPPRVFNLPPLDGKIKTSCCRYEFRREMFVGGSSKVAVMQKM